MKATKLITLISLYFMTVGCGPSERAMDIASLSGDQVAGKTHYNDLCASCHGHNGKGGTGANLIEHRSHHDDAEMIDVIIEGDDGMPSFKHLEDQTIADLISYIRSL